MNQIEKTECLGQLRDNHIRPLRETLEVLFKSWERPLPDRLKMRKSISQMSTIEEYQQIACKLGMPWSTTIWNLGFVLDSIKLRDLSGGFEQSKLKNRDEWYHDKLVEYLQEMKYDLNLFKFPVPKEFTAKRA